MSRIGFLLSCLLAVACDPTSLSTRTSALEGGAAEFSDIQSLDHLERPYSLAEALRAGPVVVIFYRGHW